ncbi:MAG: M48 family metallopeptidase [Azonexus sp.]|nr:M48 family metallopeptidase [Azonexus sp.]
MPRPPTEASAAASRSITLAGQQVAYQLRRSRRRTIGLAIDQRGLRVGAPLQARLGDIESLIRQHGEWVLDKLAAWRERPATEKLAVADGTVISALGAALTVTVTPGSRQRWLFSGDKLHLFVPPAVAASIVLEKALREKARIIFSERLTHYAPALGVAPPPLRLSAARTRWGSCSHHGGISLNWRLLFMPLPVVDYVVAHELAHLKEMNHSPRFWSVVEQLCPDWRARRLELRQLGRQIPQFK